MDHGTETAVCLLRTERQSDGILITMLVTRDVATGVQDPPRHFADVGSAVDAVAAFLSAISDKSD